MWESDDICGSIYRQSPIFLLLTKSFFQLTTCKYYTFHHFLDSLYLQANSIFTSHDTIALCTPKREAVCALHLPVTRQGSTPLSLILLSFLYDLLCTLHFEQQRSKGYNICDGTSHKKCQSNQMSEYSSKLYFV